MKFVLKIVGWLHWDFNFVWVLDGLQKNLEKEINLINEAKNSIHFAERLSKLSFIRVFIQCTLHEFDAGMEGLQSAHLLRNHTCIPHMMSDVPYWSLHQTLVLQFHRTWGIRINENLERRSAYCIEFLVSLMRLSSFSRFFCRPSRTHTKSKPRCSHPTIWSTNFTVKTSAVKRSWRSIYWIFTATSLPSLVLAWYTPIYNLGQSWLLSAVAFWRLASLFDGSYSKTSVSLGVHPETNSGMHSIPFYTCDRCYTMLLIIRCLPSPRVRVYLSQETAHCYSSNVMGFQYRHCPFLGNGLLLNFHGITLLDSKQVSLLPSKGGSSPNSLNVPPWILGVSLPMSAFDLAVFLPHPPLSSVVLASSTSVAENLSIALFYIHSFLIQSSFTFAREAGVSLTGPFPFLPFWKGKTPPQCPMPHFLELTAKSHC